MTGLVPVLLPWSEANPGTGGDQHHQRELEPQVRVELRVDQIEIFSIKSNLIDFRLQIDLNIVLFASNLVNFKPI